MHTVIIMGAAGRDFHNFNVFFRNNPDYNVIAFTAAQIPDIDDRAYPAELAGELYPNGIPIHAEEMLAELITKHKVDTVFFSYSDISHTTVMNKASLVLACGANFSLLSPAQTSIESTKPVVAVCAVRTGCGKSPVTRHLCDVFTHHGRKPVIIRHPMPYGNLAKQAVQRFATLEDIDAANCTVEEREEYEHHVAKGFTVFAGVDYERILREAEKEGDIIIWDGGNNDTPFIKPSVHITILDPLRAGHERQYHPGEVNLRLADIAVISKVNSAEVSDIASTMESVASHAPAATLILADSAIHAENEEQLAGKRVLLVEDGPTLTHGEMAFGAAALIASQNNAHIVDPQDYAVGCIAEAYAQYPHLSYALPAMGYSQQQLKDLEATINAVDCDYVLLGTPINLTRLINIKKPTVQVTYTHQDKDSLTITEAVLDKLGCKLTTSGSRSDQTITCPFD